MNLCLQLGGTSIRHHLLYTRYKNDSQGDKLALQAIAATLRATFYARLYACLPSLEADLFLPHRTREKYIKADLFLPHRIREKYINFAPRCERCRAPVGVPGWPPSHFFAFCIGKRSKTTGGGSCGKAGSLSGCLGAGATCGMLSQTIQRRKNDFQSSALAVPYPMSICTT
jgi:hypothetical protein